MRRLAHCLILLLAPAMAHGAEAFDSPSRSGCTYAPEEAEREAGPVDPAALLVQTPPPAPSKAAKPQTPPAQAGGGSDEEVLPRLRAPRWHRLLPGMFR